MRNFAGAGFKPAPAFCGVRTNLVGAVNDDNLLYLAGMPQACYILFMANIQVKNVPENLHNRLRRYAREQGCTLGDIILESIEREVARREWHKRFANRPSTRLRRAAAKLLEEERRQRDSDLS